MNADRLLAHYEKVADAPDAIPRLRHFILDLAVRGKLVEQDPNDEPASELLTRIAKEKARLMKVGKIRRHDALPTVKSDESPFGIPATWCWTRFGNTADFSAGRTPARKEPSFWNSGDHAWVSIADMKDGETLTSTKETVTKKAAKQVFGAEPKRVGTVIMSFKLTIGKIARLGIPAYHNEAVISIRPYTSDLERYLFKALPIFARQGNTKGAIKGATLNRNSISNILIPLPPLTEQHRIVAKVDELVALCEQLEAARTKRETTRDRLTAASLARLDAPDPDPAVFQNYAAFALDNLIPLTTRPDQVKALRQTILNLAVRGKLVPQDPNDEPASELLKRIAAARMLVPASGRKTKKPFGDSSLTEVAFPLPAGWKSAQLSELVRVLNGRAYKKAELLESGTPVLRVGNLFTSNHWYYSDLELEEDKHCDVGDLIYAWSASFGPFIWQGPRVIYHYHIWKLPLSSEANIDKRFLYFFLLQKTKEIKDAGHGISMAHMTKEKMEQLAVPFPPLAEQHRIVAKVDELMALCDRLEASLTKGDDTRRGLLDALLHEAPEPVNGFPLGQHPGIAVR